MQSAAVLSRGGLLVTDDLPATVRTVVEEAGAPAAARDGSLPRQIEALERKLIEEALAAEGGVQYRAAERLGISERTLRYKLEKYKYRG